MLAATGSYRIVPSRCVYISALPLLSCVAGWWYRCQKTCTSTTSSCHRRKSTVGASPARQRPMHAASALPACLAHSASNPCSHPLQLHQSLQAPRQQPVPDKRVGSAGKLHRRQQARRPALQCQDARVCAIPQAAVGDALRVRVLLHPDTHHGARQHWPGGLPRGHAGRRDRDPHREAAVGADAATTAPTAASAAPAAPTACCAIGGRDFPAARATVGVANGCAACGADSVDVSTASDLGCCCISDSRACCSHFIERCDCWNACTCRHRCARTVLKLNFSSE